MNDWVVGLDRVPWHFFGFGIPFGFLTFYGGWGTAAALVAWRVYAEYGDWRQGRDTLGKALIDFFSQVAVAVGVAVLKQA